MFLPVFLSLSVC